MFLSTQVAQEEMRQAQDRKSRQREEVIRSNEMAIALKREAKLAELEEDRKIAEYVKAEEEKKRCV